MYENIYNKDFKCFLKESYRTLKKWWMFIICMPSIEKITKAMYCDEYKDAWDFIKKEHLKSYALEDYVCWGNYINDVVHLCFWHKYLYDFDYIKYIWKKIWYSQIQKIKNFDIQDDIIWKHLKTVKDDFWDLTSETFVLYK